MDVLRVGPPGMALLLAGCGGGAAAAPAPAPTSAAASAERPHAPDLIAVPSSQPVVLRAAAKGAQVYKCKAKGGAAGAFEWTLKAPDAELFDERGQLIGRHYAGPAWELKDGSKVVGKLRTKVDSPEPDAIPWLLLDAAPGGGTGALANVVSIQRLETAGGRAPSFGCDNGHDGEESRVNYTAVYWMYGR